jgi:hypothetical protein
MAQSSELFGTFWILPKAVLVTLAGADAKAESFFFCISHFPAGISRLAKTCHSFRSRRRNFLLENNLF